MSAAAWVARKNGQWSAEAKAERDEAKTGRPPGCLLNRAGRRRARKRGLTR